MHPVKSWVDFPVYLTVSLKYWPYVEELESWSTFSIKIYPEVGNSLASVKVIVVAEADILPFKVVSNSKVVIATPPTGFLTSLNLT